MSKNGFVNVKPKWFLGFVSINQSIMGERERESIVGMIIELWLDALDPDMKR